MTLAHWVRDLSFDKIPDEVIRQSKQLLLDILAVAWPGSQAVGVPPVLAHFASTGGNLESTIWATGERLGLFGATLANALSASSLDYDSVHDEATVHPDIVLVPALLSLAEREGKNGKEFLAAYIAGSEMMVRLGLGVQTNPGWFLTSVFGTFATAAACAKLLGLDAIGIHRAMGICLSRAAGSQQTLIEGSFTKRLQSAFAARDGLEAALLAQCGVTSPEHMFEGTLAFEKQYVELDHERIVDRLGEKFHIGSLTVKDYPSCFCNHAAILAARDLYENKKVQADDIADCEVALTPFSCRMVGSDFRPGSSPQVAAQFSAQYSVASVLLRGGLDVADIQPEQITQSKILALASQIRVIADESYIGKFTPATVTIRTTDGRRLRSRIDQIPGTPAAPFTHEQMRVKALRCFTKAAIPMPKKQAAMLMRRIDYIDRLSTIRDLFDNQSKENHA